MMGPGLYVHVPFCRSRCRYCGFYAETGREADLKRYVAAVMSEIGMRATRLVSRPVASVFFGGGTPSLLEPEHIQAVLDAVREAAGLRPGAEVTLEANPASADVRRLAAYRRAGVNRLSIGVQSFDDDVLRWLGRIHSAAEAREAYSASREAGFAQVNLDLMCGIPGNAAEVWDATLDVAVALAPEHVSMYSLNVEKGSQLAADIRAGLGGSVNDDLDAIAYQQGVDHLTGAGYGHYEVSNFAKTGFWCRHNWACWHRAEYLGVGAAAHTYIQGVRSWNCRSLDAYMAAVESGLTPQAGNETIDAVTARRERVWLQLRTNVGVVVGREERQWLDRQDRLSVLLEADLLRWCGERIRVGRQGWPVADALALEITDLLEEEAPAWFLDAERPQALENTG